MNKKRYKLKNSILSKMLCYMLATLVMMFLILLLTIYKGGLIDQLKQNSFDILCERVTSRKNIIKGDMLQRWANLDETIRVVNQETAQFLKDNNADYTDLTVSSPLSAELLNSLSDRLIYQMRLNSATGAFLIFNGAEAPASPINDASQARAGFYVRDYDPQGGLNNNSDLMLERAPIKTAREKGITLDTYWQPSFVFTNDFNNDYFYKPFIAAIEAKGANAEDLGYWSQPFSLDENSNMPVITYSIPLIGENGSPYGVLGIDITIDYLLKQLPYAEMTEGDKASYVLAVQPGDAKNFVAVAKSGPYFANIFGSGCNNFSMNENAFSENTYEVLQSNRKASPTYGCVQYLNLYNSNTPFQGDKWALIGIVERDTLLGLYQNVRYSLLVVLVFTFLMGLGTIFISSFSLAKPITQLAKKVRFSSPNRPVVLEKINISEIDDLSEAIELLSHNVAENYSTLSKIMRTAGYQVGAFEILNALGEVKFTDEFFDVLGLSAPIGSDGFMGQDDFKAALLPLEQQKEEETSNGTIYHIQRHDGKNAWVKMQFTENNDRTLGVVSDVTADVMLMRKLQYERDYDLLTKLKNRRAFHAKLEEIFASPQDIKIAAIVMMDLDNLKYVNDTYGHDVGDGYLCCAANVLHSFEYDNVIAARMSGDEFYVYISGETQDEVKKIITNIEQGLRTSYFSLPDGQTIRIRCSAGIAWFPENSQDFLQLISFADFAMYRVKHTTKGKFSEFNKDDYNRESFLLKNKEELNLLIEGNLVRYDFQLIASAKDGTTFAYEALMRPTLPVFASPLDVLAIANSQSKLYEIEYMTFFDALEAFFKDNTPDEKSKLFINSIPSQLLSPQDITQIESIYGTKLARLVVELTEEEKPNSTFTRTKIAFLNRWNAQIALDDFGTGYNGEATLLAVSPNYIKIDQTIVRQLDQDPGRKQIIKNIVSYANTYNIKVIGEGVETSQEMQALIECGVHYLQGFYLGTPQHCLTNIPEEIRIEILEANKNLEE